MARETVTEAGFYKGVFLKPGASYDFDDAGDAPKLDRMKKDELVAFAKAKGIEVDAAKTNAEIIATIEGAA